MRPCPLTGDTGQGATSQGKGGADGWTDGHMEVSPSSPKASTSPAAPPARCPPARVSSSLWPAPGWLQHPQGGGATVTHPILATSRNPDSGLRAHAVPCPSLPASPTLSPALSTWHTWARGDWRHSPPLWGTKGRGRVGSRCHSPPPSLLSSLPLMDVVQGCALFCAPHWGTLERCGSVLGSAAHNPVLAVCCLHSRHSCGSTAGSCPARGPQ